jgi:hypothetical protein
MRLYLNSELAATEGKVIERHDIRHNDTQDNGTRHIDTHVLGHIEHFIAVYIQHAECPYAKYRYAECHCAAEYRYDACHYAERHYI